MKSSSGVRLVFIHGWALGPAIWDLVGPRLEKFPQARVDLGYFGAAGAPAALSDAFSDPRPGDILVGHSAGFLWGLRQRPDWAGAVAINSFSRFCLDARGRGCVQLAQLRAMRTALARDADQSVKNFRAFIAAPPPGPANAAALAEGLALLADFDAAPQLGNRPLCVLAARDDVLAPLSEAENLARTAGGTLALSAKGGHGLPWTAPKFCAEKIEAFLNAHGF
ncbi:alpha/beta hydrolase [uncultured Rhodoblastus sp.]|uniref:alpha/beta fold hydrolase n=1 Tax=uncultured Rhodoblastus sp. TaxID=543037 RepID=UPI0025E6424F|nr:alpha/beta hydrolase [uncultured Rhodoblastus sp.]